MDLMNYKLIVDYAYEEYMKFAGGKMTNPDQYKKRLLDWKCAKRLYIRRMNKFIETDMGKNVIVFEIPAHLKEPDESI